MSRAAPRGTDPRIIKALEETGAPYAFEPGTRHVQIRVGGRLAGILPRGSTRHDGKKAILNTIAQIRRAASAVTA